MRYLNKKSLFIRKIEVFLAEKYRKRLTILLIIQPAVLVHNSNSGEMEAFLFDFSPNFCHFRGIDRIIKPNNRPKKKKV